MTGWNGRTRRKEVPEWSGARYPHTNSCQGSILLYKKNINGFVVCLGNEEARRRV